MPTPPFAVAGADGLQSPEHVPGRSHYQLDYLLDGRIFSYASQLHTALRMRPRTILEVGVGAGMVAAALRTVAVQVTTLDIQSELNPDLVGSVTAIPAKDEEFDVIMCCQVLEHLPFEAFGVALRELRRVAVRGMVLSLPDVSRAAYVAFRLPILGRRGLWMGLPRLRVPQIPRERLERMGHYWEIGYRGFGLSRVSRTIRETGWIIERSWRVAEMPWHRFFDLRRA